MEPSSRARSRRAADRPRRTHRFEPVAGGWDVAEGNPRHLHGVLLQRITDSAVLPDEPLIAAATLAELAVGPLVADDADERARRQAHRQQAEADFVPLPFDAAAARAFGLVAASMRRAGRVGARRSYDLMIAAIAIANGLPLYTCNPKDFGDIDRLEVFNVPVPPPGRDMSVWR